MSAISSATIDLPLVTILAPTERQISQDRGAGLLGVARPMHLAAGGGDVALVELEVEIEMRERVVLDRAARLRAVPRIPAAARSPAARRSGKPVRASPSARCKIGSARPARAFAGKLWLVGDASALSRRRADRRERRRSCRRAPRRHGGLRPGCRGATSLPAMLSRQPRSPASTASAPVAAMSAALSVTILSEISGYLTQNVPPKPQHTSAPGNSVKLSPSTDASSARGCCLTPSSRSPEQAS